MASHRDDVPPSQEVLRQLGAAIDVAAARTGIPISKNDTALLALLMGSLTPGELRTLANSPDQILAKVADIITRYADAELNAQAARTQRKEPDAGDGPDDVKGFYVTARRGTPGDLLRQLSDRASNEARSGTARYAEAGMSASIPGNADMSGVTMANYYTSPLTRAIAGMGMSYGTFDYLRQVPGASHTNILHAAQDASMHGFSANDRRVTKAFTVIDRDDSGRREERNGLIERFGRRMSEDREIADLRAARERATSDEDRARINRLLMERGVELSRESGFREHIETMPTSASREAGHTVEGELIKKHTGASLELHNKRGIAPADTSGLAQEIVDVARRSEGLDAETRHVRDSNSAIGASRTEARRVAAADDAFGTEDAPSPAAPASARNAATTSRPAENTSTAGAAKGTAVAAPGKPQAPVPQAS